MSKKRALVVYECQLWNLLKDKEKQACLILGPKFDYKLTPIIKEIIANVKTDKGKPLIKPSRFETIKKHSEKYKKIYEQNSISQDFANWYYSTRLIGFNPGKTLREIFLPKCSSLIPISEVQDRKENSKVDFIGKVEENPVLGTSRTARKSKYAKYMISDESGAIKVMIFNESLEEMKDLNGGLAKEGDVVIVKGVKKSEDVIFANLIATQQNVIYTKLADFKDEVLD